MDIEVKYNLPDLFLNYFRPKDITEAYSTGNIKRDKRKVFAISIKRNWQWLIKCYRGVIGECVLTFGISNKVILRHLCVIFAKKLKQKFQFSLTGIFSINSYPNQTYKGCIETARMSRFWTWPLFWLLVNFFIEISMFWKCIST